MPVLRPANDFETETVLAESHGRWGAGLTEHDYRSMWMELQQTPWARRWFRVLVWAEREGEVLSSLKAYRPEARIGTVRGRTTVLAAILTPAGLRGRGHATAMTHAVLELARKQGDHSVLLFSDIGTRFYSRIGFSTLPAREWWGRLRHPRQGREGVPALRPLDRGDLDQVARSHADACRSRPVAILRDLDHWRFLLTRAESFFTRLDGSTIRERFSVATRDGGFAGYLISLIAGDTWIVREAGAPGADPRDVAAVIRAGIPRAAASGCSRVFGWFGEAVAQALPELELVASPRKRAIPMIRPIDSRVPLAALTDPESAFLPYLDQF